MLSLLDFLDKHEFTSMRVIGGFIEFQSGVLLDAATGFGKPKQGGWVKLSYLRQDIKDEFEALFVK